MCKLDNYTWFYATTVCDYFNPSKQLIPDNQFVLLKIFSLPSRKHIKSIVKSSFLCKSRGGMSFYSNYNACQIWLSQSTGMDKHTTTILVLMHHLLCYFNAILSCSVFVTLQKEPAASPFEQLPCLCLYCGQS